MTYIVMAGLALGLAAAVPSATPDHMVRIDHHGGPVEARYRGDVTVAHKQVGSVGAAGRASSLRCVWTANMTVSRQARTPTGATMARSFVRDGLATGSRPGWCSTHREAIAKEVARRTQDMDGHLKMMAQEDHDVLRAELDQLHGATRTG